jgi:hypothetical protein
MQLTKDDEVGYAKDGEYLVAIDEEKFQQVVDFYTNFRKNHEEEMKKHPELFDRWMKETKGTKVYFIDWLFNHCFVEGLKEHSETVDDHPIMTPDICKKITKDGLK